MQFGIRTIVVYRLLRLFSHVSKGATTFSESIADDFTHTWFAAGVSHGFLPGSHSAGARHFSFIILFSLTPALLIHVCLPPLAFVCPLPFLSFSCLFPVRFTFFAYSLVHVFCFPPPFWRFP